MSSPMARERLEITDVDGFNSETKLTTENKLLKSGCYVSTLLGFVFVMLAVAIAVGVGVIVYFASGREVLCQCGSSEVSSIDVISPLEMRKCVRLAEKKDHKVCTVCTRNDEASTPASNTTPTKVENVRLPIALLPLYYDLELQPLFYSGDPATFTFRGFVRIVMECVKETSNVTLHMRELNITQGTLAFSAESGASSGPAYQSWEEDTSREFLIVHLDRDLSVGAKYIIQMNFTGPLKEDLSGLYLSSYKRGNETAYLATTQFQPTDARKAFPCFDEPAIKSHFNITLVRPAHLISLSNTPIRDSSRQWTENSMKWVSDVYETTPKMSTYLLAFVVSDFVSINGTTINNIMYRVWTRPESIEQATYALNIGLKVLPHLENYYNIAYPLPKQDMIAIPDFSAGAMENWGLITYREVSLLYQPGVSSERNKFLVAAVVSHELAHQWFGNLVTPSWWDDLWLNEGFASYMEYEGLDHVHADWKVFDQFVLEENQNVFEFDGLASSHPLYVPVNHPVEISEIFDRISYSKGAAIIRMMKHFLGNETFRAGLKNYLTKRAYDSAFHDDLWAAMSAQAQMDGKDLDVKAIMDTWSLQMNYPVVTLTRSGPESVKVTQMRYLQDPTVTDPGTFKSSFGYTWNIPITLTSSLEKNFYKADRDVFWFWRSDPESTITAKGILPPENDTSGWIIGNVLQYGYYRVNYDNRNWEALCQQLRKNYTVIPSINRAQIINDAWNLARGNYLSMTIAVKTLEYLDKEMDYIPWEAASAELGFVDTMLSRTAIYGDFRKFVLSKVQAPFSVVTMNNTAAPHLQSYLRSTLTHLACFYGNQLCITNATALFKKWMIAPNTNPIDPDLKGTVYCTAIREGGLEEWDFAYYQYKDADVAAEQSLLQAALACSTEPWILSRYLEKALIRRETRKQDATDVIGEISKNKIGRGLVWDFFRANWDVIRKDFGNSMFTFASLIDAITYPFNTEFDLQQLREFSRLHPDKGSGTRAFEQAFEKTRGNIAWMSRNYEILKSWLETQRM